MSKEEIEKGVVGASTIENTIQTEDLQWTKYKASQGHGFAAEDANALNDKLHFKKVEKVGLDNAKNGADRISNGQLIQTKYCQTSTDSVNAAFDNNTGLYRYNKMQLEVPKDQYDEAVSIMREKIQEGKVPGVTNPDDASKIIRKGSVTYKQAKNIAKAGNIDSIVFDIKTQAISGLCGFGISFAIQYAVSIWNGMKPKQAVKISVLTGLKTGAVVLGTGVFTQQFLRTQAGRNFAAFTTRLSRKVVDSLYKTTAGKKAIEKIASSLVGKKIVGASAKSVVSKFLRSNAVTATVTAVVFSLPDLYKTMFSKRISPAQFLKNTTVTVSSILGGIGGGALGGACLGAPGAVIGGIAGGLVAALGTKKIGDLITKDDAEKMFALVQEAISQLGVDYLISEQEFSKLPLEDYISKNVNQKWLEDMYASGNSNIMRQMYAYNKFEPMFEEIVKQRSMVYLPKRKIINKYIRQARRKLFYTWLKSKIFFWTKCSKELYENDDENTLVS